MASTPPRRRIVALGGGHGLYASLSALRELDVDITAVVTVADDGGSSGRIRRELDVLPPGDLRMALAALAAAPAQPVSPSASASTSPPSTATTTATPTSAAAPPTPPGADNPFATAAPANRPDLAVDWAEILQHRMGGHGALAGHPIGNLLLTGLLELYADDPVRALDLAASVVAAQGRVLPMASRPLDLIAEVTSTDPDDPQRFRRIRGQSSIAATPGRVASIALVPVDARACPEAVEAIRNADVVLLGPGSWYTSVIPHLLVRELAEAIVTTQALVVTILNLAPQAGETDGFSPEEHLRVLRAVREDLRVDAVIADADAVSDSEGLRRYAESIGARLSLTPVAEPNSSARHDPARLSSAIASVTGLFG
ncbi:2-phospho-L-lactate transferase CofD family protein [Jatrophihabitans telluris]|uniref:Putative gluconeogenesis factor n=1 Tax=Jatrophihabitans telluris TaxID=2038343 RepID=A0ABY4R2N6_9ACTN|nr:2-phospho-L-lactate transferase CofD family protein [Jatrophihabitans telluris]UQX90168.1 2-phospho-L-lactate transferase CofD family protein [Jatrophihabitans telluris]